MLAPSSQDHRCLEVKPRTVCRGILRGFPEKQRTAVDTIAWDSERVFRLGLGVFPADEHVETNEVGNLRSEMSNRRFKSESELECDWCAFLAFRRQNIWPLRLAKGAIPLSLCLWLGLQGF
jgi:hypothetical protein